MFIVVTNSFCKTNDSILENCIQAVVNFKQTVVKAELCTLLFFFTSFFVNEYCTSWQTIFIPEVVVMHYTVNMLLSVK